MTTPVFRNPFEYEAANNLTIDEIIDYYIEDHNYSRFLRSKRNVFVVGERGSGKTMALVYNSLPVQLQKVGTSSTTPPPLDFIGVYVPCKTPLTHKTEYQLLDSFQGSVLSEHYLTLSIAYEVVNTLSYVQQLTSGGIDAALRDQIEFSLDLKLPPGTSLFEGIKQALQREATLTQREVNSPEAAGFYKYARSFSSTVIPLLDIFRTLAPLKHSHFMLLLDDAHDLNDSQIRALNSWIAYRDHSVFSFKVAAVKVGQPHHITASGGSIFEGHDYIQIDLEQPYQNDESNFGRLATEIVQRRLSECGISGTPTDFFPVSEAFERELEECRNRVREDARKKHPNASAKAISDYVYKHARAEWFRSRPPQANHPAYSGFQTLVFLSTGVIRNLLEPCYWMYDDALSQANKMVDGVAPVSVIIPQLQRDRILDRSKRLWERVQNDLDKSVEGCTRKQAEMIFNLFDNLAILFRERLERHQSEPRAISFSISSATDEEMDQLRPLLDIARKAQLLYSRLGPSKEKGGLETYYVPNRMLWPARGLDPYGQHARVSLKAADLLNAANGRKLPYVEAASTVIDEQTVERQKELFDE